MRKEEAQEIKVRDLSQEKKELPGYQTGNEGEGGYLTDGLTTIIPNRSPSKKLAQIEDMKHIMNQIERVAA